VSFTYQAYSLQEDSPTNRLLIVGESFAMLEGAPAVRDASAFPFLELPREIRDLIYCLLLVHTDIRSQKYGQKKSITYFALHSAIIYTSHQVYLEAKEIFFSDTEFVIFKVRADVFSPCTDNIPIFRNLAENKITKPVFKATITKFGEDELLDAEWMTLITTPEGIINIVEYVWRRFTEVSTFGHDLHLTLKYYNNFPSRRSRLVEQLLLPWDQVQGFKRVKFIGDIGTDMYTHLREYMGKGPPVHTIPSTLDALVIKADKYYEQKQYHLAKAYYTAGETYSNFRFIRLNRLEQSERSALFDALFPSYLKTKLGALKVGLRLRTDYLGVAQASDALKVLLKDAIQRTRRPVGSPGQYRINPEFCVKVAICRTMARLALGRDKTADELQTELHYWMEDSTFATKPRAQDFYPNWTNVYPQLKHAGDDYLEELGKRPTHFSPAMLSSKHWPKNGNPNSQFRTFWEWLEHPEEVFVPRERKKEIPYRVPRNSYHPGNQGHPGNEGVSNREPPGEEMRRIKQAMKREGK
jgi:hypothetical protein